MKRRLMLAAVPLLCACFPAFGRAPDSGTAFPLADPDALHAFFKGLRNPKTGKPCCGDPDPDCRPVQEVRSDNAGHYEALVLRIHFVQSEYASITWRRRFGDVEEAWIKVPPESAFARPDNPTHGAVLCYSLNSDTVYCFIPWDTDG